MNVASRKACLFGKGHTAGMALIPAGAFKMGDTLNGENKPKPTVNVIYENCLSNNSMLYPFCWRGNRSDTANLDELAEKYRLTPPTPLQMGVFINLVKRGDAYFFEGHTTAPFRISTKLSG